MSVKEKVEKARGLINEMEQMMDLVSSEKKSKARNHLNGLRDIFYQDVKACIDIYVKMPKKT